MEVIDSVVTTFLPPSPQISSFLFSPTTHEATVAAATGSLGSLPVPRVKLPRLPQAVPPAAFVQQGRAAGHGGHGWLVNGRPGCQDPIHEVVSSHG